MRLIVGILPPRLVVTVVICFQSFLSLLESGIAQAVSLAMSAISMLAAISLLLANLKSKLPCRTQGKSRLRDMRDGSQRRNPPL